MIAGSLMRLLGIQLQFSSDGSKLISAVSLDRGRTKIRNGALYLRNQIENSILIPPPNKPDLLKSQCTKEAELRGGPRLRRGLILPITVDCYISDLFHKLHTIFHQKYNLFFQPQQRSRPNVRAQPRGLSASVAATGYPSFV